MNADRKARGLRPETQFRPGWADPITPAFNVASDCRDTDNWCVGSQTVLPRFRAPRWSSVPSCEPCEWTSRQRSIGQGSGATCQRHKSDRRRGAIHSRPGVPRRDCSPIPQGKGVRFHIVRSDINGPNHGPIATPHRHCRHAMSPHSGPRAEAHYCIRTA